MGIQTLTVSELIDKRGFSGVQIAAILLCAVVGLLDGLDSQSIAVAAPIIADQLGVARWAFGPVFSTGVLGAMIGALVCGPLGDRYGRKRVLIANTVTFAVFTLLTAYASTYNSLLAIRFLAGLGLGGATPCFISLATEMAPTRRRAMIASVIWASFPLGGTIGGFLNAFLLAHFNWQFIFLVGGIAPLVAALVMILWLPESLRFLAARGSSPEKLNAIARRIVPNLPVETQIVPDASGEVKSSLRTLFTEGRGLGTFLLWVPFFGAFGLLGLTVNWAPILLKDHGMPPTANGIALGCHFAGALIGMAAAGRVMEIFGAGRILISAAILGAVAVSGLGYAAASLPLVCIDLALIGLFVGCLGSGSIALATTYYPTPIRSSGIGWAMGMGRFGQVCWPLLTGALVSLGGTTIFLIYGLAPLIAALAVWALLRIPSPLRVSEPTGLGERVGAD